MCARFPTRAVPYRPETGPCCPLQTRAVPYRPCRLALSPTDPKYSPCTLRYNDVDCTEAVHLRPAPSLHSRAFLPWRAPTTAVAPTSAGRPRLSLLQLSACTLPSPTSRVSSLPCLKPPLATHRLGQYWTHLCISASSMAALSGTSVLVSFPLTCVQG